MTVPIGLYQENASVVLDEFSVLLPWYVQATSVLESSRFWPNPSIEQGPSSAPTSLAPPPPPESLIPGPSKLQKERNLRVLDVAKRSQVELITPAMEDHWIEDAWTEEREKAAQDLLQKDTKTLDKFWREKLEREASKQWNLFYRRNKTNFYKDRHYLHLEFPELDCSKDHEGNPTSQAKTLLEVGCGVGNAAFPLLEHNPNLTVIALDFAPQAISFVKAHELYRHGRCHAFVCDITADPLPSAVVKEKVDLVLLLFCLSAIAPNKMQSVLTKLSQAMKPGARLLFRDYGRYDQAQLRFSPGHKLEDNFYVRQDGTRAYYFTTDDFHNLCTAAGLRMVENRYIRRQYINRQQQQPRFRVWIHAKYEKPE